MMSTTCQLPIYSWDAQCFWRKRIYIVFVFGIYDSIERGQKGRQTFEKCHYLLITNIANE